MVLACSDQLKKEVGRLQAGLAALFKAIQKPTADMVQLQSDQVSLNGMVSEVDRTKAEVTAAIAQLSTKCSQLDNQVPELREKLETAVATINVRSTLRRPTIADKLLFCAAANPIACYTWSLVS